MNDNGFIRLHRSLMQWEWYTDANTFRVFMHILLSANWQEGRFKGQDVKRGQLITTVSRLSKELKLTNKQIRVALDHLSKTNEILANGVANRWTLITVQNYDKYQLYKFEKGEQNGERGANRGQTEGKPRAMIEEIKEEKERKNKKNILVCLTNMEYEQLLSHIEDEDQLLFSDTLLDTPTEGINNFYSYAVGVAKNLGIWREI